MPRDTRKPSASLDPTPAPSISPDDSYAGARVGAVAMGRYFVVWVRPSRSLMPWKPLADSRGSVVVKRDRENADDCARRVMESGLCAVVGEPLLPIAPDDRLYCVGVGGDRRDALDD